MQAIIFKRKILFELWNMIDGIKSILNLIVLSVIWRICYSIIITISMSNTFNSLLRVSLIAVLILCASADNYPIDVINGREYEGNFSAAQSGQSFDYLNGREGRLIAIFYGQPNRDVINSFDLFFLDPRYQDSKMVRVEVKGIVDIGTKNEWVNESHPVTITTIWKEREQKTQNVSTSVFFEGLQQDDYQMVKMKIQMRGPSFDMTAQLSYYNQIISTLAYSLFVSAVVGIQIYSGYVLVKIMDAPNFVFTAKMSLLSLSLCNIQDFSQTMSHIQYIMGSESGYLFFIIPVIAYIVLFIIFDMKMLFLVWRSHNMRNMENPQLLRKKLTAFYIQFYLGLFLYLTLTYFFSNDQWMIVLRNLILIPQIVHNIRLGNNPGFNPFYIFGFVGSRLLLPIYQRLCPQNRFNLTPNMGLVVVLISIFALQVGLLFLQSKLGSRFFVPKRFLPNYFNYKLKIKCDESNKELECSICLQNLFEQPMKQADADVLNMTLIEANMNKEVSIMNTPCNHKFHEECLSQWMQVKLECPTCRAVLPSI